MKRRRLLDLAGPYAVQQPDRDETDAKTQAGQELRKDFIELYLTEQISAVKLCDMAHRHTISGGVGSRRFGASSKFDPPQPQRSCETLFGNS